MNDIFTNPFKIFDFKRNDIEIEHKNAKYISGNIEEASKKIYSLLKENDIVITLGAGTVTKIGSLIEKCR